MRKDMKNYKLLVLLCLVGLSFASCKDKSDTEWENYYGYTNKDILGTYSFSNVSDAFEGVEGEGRYACQNAEISISTYSGSQVEFKINCPSQGFNRSFTGKPSPNADDFMVHMSTGYQYYGNGRLRAYNVTGYVLKNPKQQLRIHGYASMNTYKLVPIEGVGTDTIPDDGKYYYFDVIKN